MAKFNKVCWEAQSANLMCEFASRSDEGATVRCIEGAAAATGRNDEVGLRPRRMKRPCTLHVADNIGPGMIHCSRNLAGAPGSFEKLGIGLHKTLVDEIMASMRTNASANSSSS
jgi:hypothetical protein